MTLRSTLRTRRFSLALLSPIVLSAQEPPNPLHTASRQELNIIKVLLAQENAWNKGDLAAFASGYKDSPDTFSSPTRSSVDSPASSTSTSTTTPTEPRWAP